MEIPEQSLVYNSSYCLLTLGEDSADSLSPTANAVTLSTCTVGQ